MRVLVVGAGAIGGLVAGVLAESSEAVSVCIVARGAHLAAMRAKGGIMLHLNHKSNDATKHRRDVFASRLLLAGSLAEAASHGPYDFVLLTVKAHQLHDVAKEWVPTLSTSATCFVTLQNGLPWWFFLTRAERGAFAGKRIACLDPERLLERTFPVDQIAGGVALPAASMSGPGVIVHETGWRIVLGAGQHRVQEIADALHAAGFEAVLRDVRAELWTKVLGSAMFNPLSMITGATLVHMATEAEDVCLAGMDEVRAVALSVGHPIPVTNDKRLKGARGVGAHKTSMLQDVEAGKTDVELDALVTSVIEIASWSRVPTPTLTLVRRLALLKLSAMKLARL